MEESGTCYCTVLDKQSRCRYICSTRRKHGGFTICLTDATDFWMTDYTEETLSQFKQMFALKSTEDYILKLRSACGSGDTSVVVHDTSSELHVGSGPQELMVTLSRLEGPQARAELKELLFGMADSLTQPHSAATSVTPRKNHQRCPAEFEPLQQQKSAPSVPMKKRLAGTSLINPGTKKKMQATGVAFDNADDD